MRPLTRIPFLKLTPIPNRTAPRVKEFVRYNTNSKQRWLQRQHRDRFAREAKLQNWRSRAAFKLIEIDDKYNIFKRSKPQCILDLGFAPGSWSQVARERSNPRSIVLGVDILPVEPIAGVFGMRGNVLSSRTQELIREFFFKEEKISKKGVVDSDVVGGGSAAIASTTSQYPVDVVLSDIIILYNIFPTIRLMNTSGIPMRDHMQSIDLCDAALVTAIDLLKPSGSFVCKLYTGNGEDSFRKRLQKCFKRIHKFKPVSSRSESKEIYYVCIGKKDPIDKIAVFTES